MTKLILSAILLLAPEARAEFSFHCGHGRHQGAGKSEIAFVDEQPAPMKLLFNGEEVSDDLLGFKALDGGRWIVSVDRGTGEGTRKFVFAQKPASVQEFLVADDGTEKKAGASQPCRFLQKK